MNTNDTHDSFPPRDENDDLLDAATRAACDGGPSPDQTARARASAWQRLVAEDVPAGCIEVRRDLAGLLAGSLTAGRTELLNDHCRECVPCRRELMKAGGHHAPAMPPPPARSPWRRAFVPAALAASAALAALVSIAV